MTNEGGFSFPGFLGMLKDGSPGIEHFNPIGYDNYKDIQLLMAASKTFFTPTMQISNQGGEQGQWYFNDVYKSSYDTCRFKRFSPNELNWVLKSRRENTNNPPDFSLWAKQATTIRKLGGKIVMGSHGQVQGLGAHFEIWALQMGGMSNYEALQTATVNGADALGMQKDLGSIEVGKIADLIILNKNPLEDIHNTLSIRFIVKDGVLYDGEDLNIVWPANQTFLKDEAGIGTSK